MVLTRSMMKEQGLRPITAMPVTKRVHTPAISMHGGEPGTAAEPVEDESFSKPLEHRVASRSKDPSWSYLAVFIPAFAYCVWQKSALGLVCVSLLSQVSYSVMFETF